MSDRTKAQWRMEVEWVDSTLTHQEGWVPIRSVLARRARRDAVRCLSVGFVLADDDAGIVLAATVHGNEVAGITHIPSGAIISRKRLQPALSRSAACASCRQTEGHAMGCLISPLPDRDDSELSADEEAAEEATWD